MTGSRGIRVVSLVVLPNAEGTAHAVARLSPSLENPDGYHRLIGGGVEPGETAAEAIIREVREELGATLVEVAQVGVVENLFELDGAPGHEVVFVHTGRLVPEDVIAVAGGVFADNGEPMPVEWRPVDDVGVTVPLYPTGIGDLVRQLVREARHPRMPSSSRPR